MPILDAVSLASLLLEDDHLVRFDMVNNGRAHGRTFDVRASNRDRTVIADKEYVLKFDLLPHFNVHQRNEDLLLLINPVLLAGDIYNSVHFQPQIARAVF